MIIVLYYLCYCYCYLCGLSFHPIQSLIYIQLHKITSKYYFKTYFISLEVLLLMCLTPQPIQPHSQFKTTMIFLIV